MAEPTPTFAGEVQLRRWSESNTQGVQVTFALAESSDLDKFKGLDGKRFMAVLVQIGDDEQPVPANPLISKQNANSRLGEKVEKSHLNREPLGDLCWRAVQWCKEPEFWRWIESCGNYVAGDIDEEHAKLYVLNICGVESRKELDTNPEASYKFNLLFRGPYQKHLIARGIVR
jgi:hypothetical protein